MKKLKFLFLLCAILLCAGCTGSNKLNGTVFDAGFFEKKIEGNITISVYDSMAYKNFLEEAARLFEEKYPGAKVNIEIFSAMPEIKTMEIDGMFVSVVENYNSPQERTDYINRVNTRVMSADGADIYAIDVLPLSKLINSGSLENLDHYMTLDPGFNKSDYKQNILEALRYKGGIWFMPLNYSFNYFKYDSALISSHNAGSFGADKAFSAEELVNFGVPLFNGSSKLFNLTGGSGGMVRQLLNEKYRSFVNMETGRANFIDGGFASSGKR